MQSTPLDSWRSWCYYPVPNHVLYRNLQLHLRGKFTPNSKLRKIQCTSHSPTTLTATRSCSEERKKKLNDHYPEESPVPGHENCELLQDFYSSIEIQGTQLGDSDKEGELGAYISTGISSNMAWARLKAALGQRINLEGITSSFEVLSKDKQLIIPHVSVRDIRYIDWGELKRMGFEGVVFDKDNTITLPYSLSLWEPLRPSVEQCKYLFGNNIAVFSNSAGLFEYDPDGRKAEALEDAIGIKVIRHKAKKPAGTAEEIERQFGCESSRLIMVGDRPFTDIVYGNKNGFFTILTEPLGRAEEPLIVKQVRVLEVAIVRQFSKQGLMPINHMLHSDSLKCVKDVPLTNIHDNE